MDAQSQAKVINNGFVILRSDDQPQPRIKYKDKEHREWATLEKYETKRLRDIRLRFLLSMPYYIQD